MSKKDVEKIHLLHDSANEEFKAKYNKYVRWALVIAVVVHFVAFVFTPAFTITPYKLKQEQFEVVDVPDQIDLPPPPPDVPPPPVAVQAAEDESEATDEVAETTFENFEDMPPPPPPGGGSGSDVFLAFDEPPALIEYAAPEYPQLARDAGIEGTVAIRVLVTEEGKVAEAIVLSSDVTPAMDQAAIKAALKCKFRPAKQRTVPVKAHVMIPFQFKLH
jgi:periplasmic protein TonB